MHHKNRAISLSMVLLLLALFIHALAIGAGACEVGAQVLHESGYAGLLGKRVGLVTNHTAVVNGTHLVDLMHTSGAVRLVALFAPEHGLRGVKEDGESFGEGRDERTGVPVFSLYGAVRKPTPEMMRGLDILLFDMQAVGARFYTFISTMGLAMQAAAEAHIPFVVLDRPNPLGGEYVAGPVLEREYASFTGRYPIPVAHGMTVGELALMIKGERMLPGLDGLDLRVVRMVGWRREMQWPQTGLAWVRTSPNIPDFETVLLYPGICLFEGTSASVGRGTREPFKLVGLPGINAAELAARLNGSDLAGVRFEAVTFTPRSIPGMGHAPKYRDKEIPGVRIIITDPHAYRPVETGVHLVCALYGSLDGGERERFFRRMGFDRLAGTSSLRLAIARGVPPEEIIASWKNELAEFTAKRRNYLIY
ncbi:MAG TPA: DUF1343 domain-containing protein [Geobacteraceae bacterium]